jgi:hypothetical protein
MGLKIENIYEDFNLYIFIVLILIIIECLKCSKYRTYYDIMIIKMKGSINKLWILWLLLLVYLLQYHFKISLIYSIIYINLILDESKNNINSLLNDYNKLIYK